MGNPALAGLEQYRRIRSEFQIQLSHRALLALLFTVQLLIYFDRGLVAACIPQLKSDLLPQPINDTSIGIIGSAFVLGRSHHMSDTHNCTKLESQKLRRITRLPC